MLYNCCIISLFAEKVLHVGQVPMLVIYIKLKSRLSACHANNSPGTAYINLSTAQHHKPIILLLQVCHCELMWWSDCGLKTKKWRKLKQNFIKNHSHIGQTNKWFMTNVIGSLVTFSYYLHYKRWPIKPNTFVRNHLLVKGYKNAQFLANSWWKVYGPLAKSKSANWLISVVGFNHQEYHTVQ